MPQVRLTYLIWTIYQQLGTSGLWASLDAIWPRRLFWASHTHLPHAFASYMTSSVVQEKAWLRTKNRLPILAKRHSALEVLLVIIVCIVWFLLPQCFDFIQMLNAGLPSRQIKYVLRAGTQIKERIILWNSFPVELRQVPSLLNFLCLLNILSP